MTKLNPDLLKACASYLAHAGTYNLDSDDQRALLRESARPVVVARRCRDEARSGSSRSTRELVADISAEACDELTHTHLEAIRKHARPRCENSPTRMFGRECANSASAILDATPAMLAWWCRTLSDPELTSGDKQKEPTKSFEVHVTVECTCVVWVEVEDEDDAIDEAVRQYEAGLRDVDEPHTADWRQAEVFKR